MYEWRAKAWIILYAHAELSKFAQFVHVERPFFSLDAAHMATLLKLT